MSGSVVTFYSYKGGVGRSFLLANVAVLLSRWGYRVLCVDWDVEAPGLNEYFRPWLGTPDKPGLVELVTDYAERGELDWHSYVSRVYVPDSPSPLALLHSGIPDATFIRRVQEVNWRHLYDDRGFGEFLERVREDWKQEYDFVLIDSRTGVTDIGGICTVHLPDLLVFLFTANRQSLAGVGQVVRLAMDQRSRLPLNRAGLLTLPIPARFDARGQDELARKWLQEIAQELEPFYEAWLDVDISTRRALDLTRLPYFSAWTFGERLAVLEERDSDPESISYYFATIAALIARQLGDSELLARSRDSYVESAKGAGSVAAARRVELESRAEGREFTFEFFLSYSRESTGLAVKFATDLERTGVRVVTRDTSAAARDPDAALDAELERCRQLIVLAGATVSRWQLAELATFVRLAAADQRRRVILARQPGHEDELLSALLSPLKPQQVLSWDPTRESAQEAAVRLLAGHGVAESAPLGAIIEPLRSLADQYVAVKIADYGERVARKNVMAEELGVLARQHRVSRDALADAGHDGLTVALVDAARSAPEEGDLERLLRIGPMVQSLHAAFRLLLASVELAERVQLRPEQREAFSRLCEAYEQLAQRRNDGPLSSLVHTTRYRLAKLS